MLIALKSKVEPHLRRDNSISVKGDNFARAPRVPSPASKFGRSFLSPCVSAMGDCNFPWPIGGESYLSSSLCTVSSPKSIQNNLFWVHLGEEMLVTKTLLWPIVNKASTTCKLLRRFGCVIWNNFWGNWSSPCQEQSKTLCCEQKAALCSRLGELLTIPAMPQFHVCSRFPWRRLFLAQCQRSNLINRHIHFVSARKSFKRIHSRHTVILLAIPNSQAPCLWICSPCTVYRAVAIETVTDRRSKARDSVQTTPNYSG